MRFDLAGDTLKKKLCCVRVKLGNAHTASIFSLRRSLTYPRPHDTIFHSSPQTCCRRILIFFLALAKRPDPQNVRARCDGEQCRRARPARQFRLQSSGQGREQNQQFVNEHNSHKLQCLNRQECCRKRSGNRTKSWTSLGLPTPQPTAQ